jgi:hypothetical protein
MPTIAHFRTLILNIAKGKIHQAAITALVAVLIGTIDQLLLTELLQLAGLEEMESFQCPGRREGPAGATLSLVFHAGDCAQLAPVQFVRHSQF